MRCRGLHHPIAAKRSFLRALLRPLLRLFPVHSASWRALPQMRQNGLDRVRIGDLCDHLQGVAAQRAEKNISIKYPLKPLCPTQWRASQCLIGRDFRLPA